MYYGKTIDLNSEIDWHESESANRWPNCHYSKISYRPGNPHGDIRSNWELNRLQFLPVLALYNEQLALTIISQWLNKNPYQQGPAYISSMEVALRWISIYRALNLAKEKPGKTLEKELIGLAVCSGRFISKRLSTFSSAGNHLVIEAVGLFWIGKALDTAHIGQKWISLAREILHRETLRQINPDGSNKEQTFWYLGFVVDALFHYLLLEEKKIPQVLSDRIISALDFINRLITEKGNFPDYGDRDDGFVFRPFLDYREPYFQGLLNLGAKWFQKPEWEKGAGATDIRSTFFLIKGRRQSEDRTAHGLHRQTESKPKAIVSTYPNGGVTCIQNGAGCLVFRHAPLGLAPTYGHGHADALSILLFWDGIPLFTDIGSGQYNGSQGIRNYFRSTIAHNTIEVGGIDQSVMQGPFMWERPHACRLLCLEGDPVPLIEASHDGYRCRLGVTHYRRLTWDSPERILIEDRLDGEETINCRGAFHFGQDCQVVKTDRHLIEASFNNGRMAMHFPEEADVSLYRGSTKPFAGWISSRYGSWAPITTCIFHFKSRKNRTYTTKIEINRE
ncbi:heparinase II/III family protein [Desulfosarcina cetonica]